MFNLPRRKCRKYCVLRRDTRWRAVTSTCTSDLSTSDAVRLDGSGPSGWASRPIMVEAATRRYAMHTKGTGVATGKVSKAVEPLAYILPQSVRKCPQLLRAPYQGGSLRALRACPVSANGGGRPGGS